MIVPCSIYRGGTSKAVIFNETDLPEKKEIWEDFILDVMGSPDKRQIDGLGGANSLTSKVAIIKKSKREGYDVDYTFVQVSIDKKLADFNNNCGNISSAVGPYAVDSNLINTVEGLNSIKIYNTNTEKMIVSKVLVKNGKTIYAGNESIPGVPGKAAPVKLKFYSPQGAVTGKVLPTENPTDIINYKGKTIPISIVDSANPLVFVKASDLDLIGTEMPEEFTESKLKEIEEIRGIAAEMLGFCKKEESSIKSPAIPKFTIVSEPKDKSDITVRMMSMQKPHKALAITGAVCITTAALIKDTLVNSIVKTNDNQIIMNSPSGLIQTEYEVEEGKIKNVEVLRTARLIMEGKVHTKREY